MTKIKSLSSLLILLPLLSMGIWSCGSDDDEPQVTHEIVGTWVYESHAVNASVNGQNALQFLMEGLGLTESQALVVMNMALSEFLDLSEFQGTTIQFRADGTYQITSPSGVESGTYELRNNDTLLVLNDGEEVTELEVSELSTNHMTVVFEEEDEQDITDDGEEEDIIIQFSLRMQKQN
ncbi:lipocalin-like domain-containing protein [Pleomorphovibrio marinus]|uniref:lipocalin-like domain-containing protein n=1 Tax=Pleomorphovibrio marinus TaxID=2164132 RepID=UPI001300A3ED|nr:DUF4923 family protein [Pleomorphovibrio marinus]